MKMTIFFSSIFNWLKLTEPFVSPGKQIPGIWKLYEYYTEYDNELVHFNKNQLKENAQIMVLEFKDNGKLLLTSNIHLPVFKRSEGQLKWDRKRNFMTIFDSSEPDDNIEFQFALQKNHLKLLNKNKAGEIRFFGFFTKQTTTDKK